jgi:DNA polymerase-3 subunit alpha (Gram-positive type)
MLLFENTEFIFLDTETTGLSPTEEKLTEIAMIRTDNQFNILETYESFINPQKKLSAKIIQITNITDEMLEDAPLYESAIPNIYNWYYKNSPEKRIIGVAHNMPFDLGFINEAGKKILGKDIITEWIDTVSLARELYPFWKNHKLDTCATKFGIVNENHHRALNDTMVLYNIGHRLITEFAQDGLDPVNFRTQKKLHYNK